ncbi:MAG: glycosyltransferase family 4 protein [Syntrophobacteraceae bacterium]
MNVLIQTRPRLGASMTGDVTQVRATAAALERLGASVRFDDSLEPDTAGIDVAHLFSTLEPHYTYQRLRYLRERKVPTVVSTIYWEWEPEELRRESILRLGRPRYLAGKIVSFVRNRLPYRLRYQLSQTPIPYQMQRKLYQIERETGINEMRRYIYQNADVLLPNSHTEYDFLVKRFKIRNDYLAVPNAVDPKSAGGDAEAFNRKYGLRDFVLCAAVVQSRKNQIRLIRAMRNIDLPLVLAGSQERRYTERCRAEAGENIHFIDELRGDDLRNAFAAARVHALVSFYETPGLSSLEAAIADNTLVVSDRGCTREYFQDQAFYCDPNSVDSIRASLERALCATPDVLLKERILRDYSWDRTAEATLAGYQLALSKHGHPDYDRPCSQLVKSFCSDI